MIERQFLVTIRMTQDIPDLVDLVGCRLWSMDKVEFVNAAVVNALQPAPPYEWNGVLSPVDVLVETYHVSRGGFAQPLVGIRVSHMPTGIFEQCNSRPSLHANREEAMRLLRERLERDYAHAD